MSCEPLSARDRILLAGTRCFGTRGFAGTSVREVVEAASVSKPTLYYYFDNKEALFRACVEAQIEGLNSLVDQAFSMDGTIREKLTFFLSEYIGGGIDNPDSVRLLIVSSNLTDTSQPDVGVMAAYHASIQRLCGLFEGMNIDADTAVRMACGAADISIVRAIMAQEDVNPDATVRRILDILLPRVDV